MYKYSWVRLIIYPDCLALKCKSQSKKQHFSIHILILAVWELKNAATTALLLSNDISM